MGPQETPVLSQAGSSKSPHKTVINSISDGMRKTSKRDEDSGVVQQAGHAALDRRIGVRIPAPESLRRCLAPQGASGETSPSEMLGSRCLTVLRRQPFDLPAPSSRGQGRCPLTAETRVRISVGPSAKSNPSKHPLTEFSPPVSI